MQLTVQADGTSSLRQTCHLLEGSSSSFCRIHSCVDSSNKIGMFKVLLIIHSRRVHVVPPFGTVPIIVDSWELWIAMGFRPPVPNAFVERFSTSHILHLGGESGGPGVCAGPMWFWGV